MPVSGLICFLVITLCACGADKGISLARSGHKQDMETCLELVKKKKHEKAIQCYEAFKSSQYGQASSALAELALADAYFLKKDYLVAAQTYQQFIEGNPTHAKVAYAYYKLGVSYYHETPTAIDRDQTYLDQAIQNLGTVVKYYSQGPYAKLARHHFDLARLKQARHHFYVGRFYFKTREYLSAISRFQLIVTEYSKLGLDEKSFYYLIEALDKTDQKDLAQKYLDVFKTYYPTSDYVKRVKT